LTVHITDPANTTLTPGTTWSNVLTVGNLSGIASLNGLTLKSNTETSFILTETSPGSYDLSVPTIPVLAVSPSTVPTRDNGNGTLDFTITNAGTGTLVWNASLSETSWLRITSASSGSCASGANSTLSVSYDANPPASPARSATLLISAPAADNPSVSIPIAQAAGIIYIPPSISGDNLPPVTNASNNSATLSIAATGYPSPSIQWQQLVDGVWTDIPGASSGTLSLTNLKYNNNGDQFRAKITNESGTIYSDITTLASIPTAAPQIEWLPGSGSQTVAPGSNATLKFTVTSNTDATGALSYTWKKNNILIPDASADTLAISDIYSTSDTYSVTATVGIADPYEPHDIAGLSTKGVKLSVPKSLSDQVRGKRLEKNTKVVYVWTDQNGTVLNKLDKNGNPVSASSYTTKTSGIFTVALEYTPLAGSKLSIPHSFGVVKLFDPVKLPKTNAFLSSPLGAVVNDTKGNPVLDAVVEGEQLKLTVKLESGTGPLKYTWYKNKLLDSNILQTTENTYALTDSFVTDAFPAKPDAFFVVIETHERSAGGVKPLSSVKTKSLKPKVILKPRITSFTATPAVLLATTKSVSISAKVTGSAKLNYEWKHDGEIIRDAKGAAINKSAITLKLPTGADVSSLAGTYTLKVTNPSTYAAETTLALVLPPQPAAAQQAAAQQPAAAQSVMECGDLSPLSTERLVAPPTPATTTLLPSQILALLLTADNGAQTTLYLTDPQTRTYATPDGETGAYTLLIATPSEFTTTPDAPPANPRAYTLRFETETTGTYTSPTGESGTFQIQ
ncbi:MAG: hypothetical protein LBR12_04620, partial [Opitutaceae bacterium]|nr:hypothetical protein [Opitutaceae bacterium]